MMFLMNLGEHCRRVLALSIVLLLTHQIGGAQHLKFGGGADVGISVTSIKLGLDMRKFDWVAARPVESDGYAFGFGGGVHGDLMFTKTLGARLGFAFHTFSAKEDKIREAIGSMLNQAYARQFNVSVNAGNMSIIDITAAGVMKWPSGSSFTPFSLAGLGIHMLSGPDVKVNVSLPNVGQETDTFKLESQTKFGLTLGGGGELALSKTANLVFELDYIIIFTSGGATGVIPISVGATFGL